MPNEVTLGTVNTTLQHVAKENSVAHDRILKMVDEHQRAIYGGNGNPGLRTCVSLLEERENKRSSKEKLWFRTALAALVTGLFGFMKLCWDFFTRQ